MSSETSTAAHHGAPLARVAWLASFVILVALFVLLLAAKPSGAVTVTPPPIELLAEVEEDEEWEEDEEVGEEGEEGEEEAEEIETSPNPPEECLLRTARARAVAKRQRLKLTVDYTTYEPVDARVEIRSGGVQIGSAQRHLGESGVLRITKKLGKKLRVDRLVVRFRIPGTPPSCDRLQSKTIPIHR